MRSAPYVLSLIVVLAACQSRNSENRTPPTDDSVDAATTTLALPFHADDYAGTLASARERDLPLFVETWAPW